MPAMPFDAAYAFEAFLVRMSGLENRVSVYDWKRPLPRGTCNLSGVTVKTTASQFDKVATLSGCGSGGTLLAGDWIKFSTGQLVMVVADYTADGSGDLSLEFSRELRAQVTGGTAVTLQQPTALYVLSEPVIEVPRGPSRTQPGLGLDLVEVFS